MNELTQYIKEGLLSAGAYMVGIGDLSELPPDVRQGLPIGVSVVVKYPKKVISGISELPTQEYFDWYNRLNDELDGLVATGAELLAGRGYKAVPMTRAFVGDWQKTLKTTLPHKTVATRAGLGWIGKNALLVTEAYGSMIRLSSILTDAPLEPGLPVDASGCGDCTACVDACPVAAIYGRHWEAGLPREELLDFVRCRDEARERSMRGFGGEATICGRCIEACPYARRAEG